MTNVKNLLNAKILVPAAGVLVLLIAGALVTTFYIRDTAKTYLLVSIQKPGGAAALSMTQATSPRVVTISLTTILTTPPHSDTTTPPGTGDASDPNLDNSAPTSHAIEPTKQE
ncbi:hypothetical protein COOONC_03282 [Cooperia oncophora]